MSEFLHQSFMSQALEQAKRGRFTVSPNPMVGCVIVQDNKVVATGFHERAGHAHAEVNALIAAGIKTKGATAYVTLEPCCHTGKTPPCTDALIQARIKRVYVACEDPNPLVSGKGVALLQQAGIEVHVGIMTNEAQKINEIYFHYMRYRKPFVIAKWAMSLDGKTITHESDSRIISNKVSHQHAHELRRQVDAIIVGANTVIKDDPLLTVRFVDESSESIKQPLRVVLSSRGNLPLNLNVFNESIPGDTLLITTLAADKKWLEQAKDKGISAWIAPSMANGKISLGELLAELGKREITSVLVEGGMQLQQQFFAEKLINRTHVYIAPCIIGTLEKKMPLYDMVYSASQGDCHLSAYSEEHIYV